MEEIICPEPEHVRRSMEIRRAIRGLAGTASWPAYLYIAAVMALTAALIPVTALLDIRIWNVLLADYLLYAAFLFIAPVAVLDKWMAKRIAPATRPRRFTGTSAGEAPQQWYLLAAAIAALVSYLITRGDAMTWFLDFGLWFAGTGSVAEALSNRDLRCLSAGIVSISMGVLYTPPFPRVNHSRAFCMLVASFVAVAEAVIAWWAWKKWQKGHMDWLDLDAVRGE